MKLFRFLLLALTSVLLILHSSRAQIPLQVGAYRDNPLKIVNTFAGLSKAPVVTAVAKKDANGLPLPAAKQPKVSVLTDALVPGQYVVTVGYDTTSALPIDSYLELRLNGQVYAAGPMVIDRANRSGSYATFINTVTLIGISTGGGTGGGVDLVTVNNALAKKVDAVVGKGLSTLDFTTGYRNRLDSLPGNLAGKLTVDLADNIYRRQGSQINYLTDLFNKPAIPTNTNQLTNGANFVTDTTSLVRKIVGKTLTSNDFTTTLLNKLNGISAGATNVTNTNQLTNGAGFVSDTTGLVRKIAGKVLSTNDYSTTDKNKLAGIAPGATNVTDNAQLANGAGFAKNTDVNSQTLNLSNQISAKLSINDSTSFVRKLTGYRLLSPAEQTKLTNLAGTNSGDETVTTIKQKLGITGNTLSGDNTGNQTLSIAGNRVALSGGGGFVDVPTSGTVSPTTITNNLTTTITGTALDAAQGKIVADSLTAQRNRIATNTTAITSKFAVSDTNKLVQKATGYRLVSPAEQAKIANTSGTNTGDETAAGIKSKLGITNLSGSNTGDQIIANNLTTTTTGAALDAVQGKIISDSLTAQRGRIATNATTIAGKFATTDTIRLVQKVTGSRLLTIAEQTKLANTSGTNTGDETTTSIKSKLGVTTLSGANTGDQVVTNNLTTTATGTALDAVQGKVISDSLTAQRNRIIANTNAIAGKQAALVSGNNLKTVGGQSLLGSGDIPLPSGGSATALSNNLTTTSTGTGLDAVQGKIIADSLTAQRNRIAANTANFGNYAPKTGVINDFQVDGLLRIPSVNGRWMGFYGLSAGQTVRLQMGDPTGGLDVSSGAGMTVKAYHGVIVQNQDGGAGPALRVNGLSGSRNISEYYDASGNLRGGMSQAGQLTVNGGIKFGDGTTITTAPTSGGSSVTTFANTLSELAAATTRLVVYDGSTWVRVTGTVESNVGSNGVYTVTQYNSGSDHYERQFPGRAKFEWWRNSASNTWEQMKYAANSQLDVQVANGDYSFNERVYISPGTHIFGNETSPDSVRFHINGPNPYLFMNWPWMDGTNGMQGSYRKKAENIVLAGFTLYNESSYVAKKDTNDFYGPISIDGGGSFNNVIRNIKYKQVSSTAIVNVVLVKMGTQKVCESLLIDNVQSLTSTVKGRMLVEVLNQGDGSNSPERVQVPARGVEVRNCVADGFRFGISVAGNFLKPYVHHNIVRNCTDYGVEFAGPLVDGRCEYNGFGGTQNVLIAANYVAGTAADWVFPAGSGQRYVGNYTEGKVSGGYVEIRSGGVIDFSDNNFQIDGGIYLQQTTVAGVRGGQFTRNRIISTLTNTNWKNVTTNLIYFNGASGVHFSNNYLERGGTDASAMVQSNDNGVSGVVNYYYNNALKTGTNGTYWGNANTTGVRWNNFDITGTARN